MKILSIAIPCYNSEEYMGKCIESLLIGGEDVEIIVVNDGSTKDRTAEIADEYAAKYPTIVKAVHKENGGHGSAVNAGLAVATGQFFKVVDSDDWVNESSYKKVLATLKKLSKGSTTLDMLVCNYVYEKVGEINNKVMHYRNILPVNQMFTWNDCKRFKKAHYMLMHSVIYRTQLLRDCSLKLPEKTFYVDNIFVFNPLPFVENMYYLDEDFYRYYIGREDQSVNESIMISRIDQQIKVNKLMIQYYTANQERIKTVKRLDQYMKNHLEIVTTVSSILLIKSGTEENLQKKTRLWKYLKKKNPELYKWMRRGFFGMGMNLPGKVGRKISVGGYTLAQKLFKFN